MTRLDVNEVSNIKKIIIGLISGKSTLTIYHGDDETIYTSKFIKMGFGDAYADLEETPDLIIERLVPDFGNSLIQSESEFTAEFPREGSLCRCTLKYEGVSSSHPYYGIVVKFPESISMEEKRREERFVYEMPDFVSVELSPGKGPDKEKVYQLNVFDCSAHGLGLLITQEEMALYEILEPGDTIKNITFYAPSAMITVDGQVRHKTRIADGEYKDSHILGIESPEIIKNCRPAES